MKYIVILGDGMADQPLPELHGRTILQAARTPTLDRIAREGRCGLLHTLSDLALPPGSETANLSVMGYNPAEVLEGRGVLEAASMGVDIAPGQVGMRLNLICLQDGRIKNHSAGHISTDEASELIEFLNAELATPEIRFHAGVSYRHLLVGDNLDPRLICVPPHDHPGEAVEPLMLQAAAPEAEAAARQLQAMVRRSWEILPGHPVNQARISAGKDPANSIWPWSPGRRPRMWTFPEHFGVTGAVISAVDLIRGIGRYAGLEVIDVEGVTGLWDTNYEGKTQAALDALRDLDFVYVHLEGPDEAGHEGSIEQKTQAIEWLDERLAAPLLAEMDRRGEPYNVAVLPDHPTPVKTRVHTRDPIPFAIMGPGIEADSVQQYDEVSCAAGGYGQLHGDAFIRAVLGQ